MLPTLEDFPEAKNLDGTQPEVIGCAPLYPLLGRAPDLQSKLRLNETYSVAATCLLEFLTGASARNRIE